MKENTKLLLVWLYDEQSGKRWVGYSQIQNFLPKLSNSGLKSLLFLLKKKQLISLEKIDNEMRASLTSHGRRALTDEFPVFSADFGAWRGEWSVMIFLKPPAGDKNFRYLRRKILSLHFISLTRGVFLYPGDLPEHILMLCDQLYRESVIVLKSGNWVFGDELQTIGLKSGLTDSKESYSSISKEIDGLIEKNELMKGLMEKEKEHIFSVYYRLYKILDDDSGLGRYYFPQEEGFLSLLKKLQDAV